MVVESAIYNDFKKIILNVAWLVCVKHLIKRDKTKLRELLAKTGRKVAGRKRVSSEIIKDIYGTRVENFYGS